MNVDVGGQKKAFDRDLMTKVAGSRLADTFNGEKDLKKLGGSVFIDRDPQQFEHILMMLRSDFKYWPQFEDKNQENFFKTELEYWGILNKDKV